MPPTDDKRDPDLNGELFEKLRGTPVEGLRRGVAKVEGLSQKDEEDHKRWLRSSGQRLRTELYSWFLRFALILVCAVVLIVAVATLYLTWLWISSFIDDAEKLGAFLKALWNTALIALATLFINSLRPKE